ALFTCPIVSGPTASSRLTAVYQAWKAFVSFTDPVAIISRSSARPPPAGGKAPGDLDHPRRRQRSESERLCEGLPRTAGLNSGTQVETFEPGASSLRAHGVEELSPLPVPPLLGGDLDVHPGPMGVERGFGDRGSADGNVGDHLGDDGADQ